MIKIECYKNQLIFDNNKLKFRNITFKISQNKKICCLLEIETFIHMIMIEISITRTYNNIYLSKDQT